MCILYIWYIYMTNLVSEFLPYSLLSKFKNMWACPGINNMINVVHKIKHMVYKKLFCWQKTNCEFQLLVFRLKDRDITHWFHSFRNKTGIKWVLSHVSWYTGYYWYNWKVSPNHHHHHITKLIIHRFRHTVIKQLYKIQKICSC